MRIMLCLAVGIAVTAGCQGLPTPRIPPFKPRLADREAVAKALPQDHTLDQVIGADSCSRTEGADGKPHYSNPITLEDKLAEVGARVGLDGKLRDAAGKEIIFRPTVRYGCQRVRDEKEEEETRKLNEKYRVICISACPGLPDPC